MIKFRDYLKEEYQRVGNTQYGSNFGGVHVHQKTGEKYYIKFPKNEEQARVEVATANLYKAIGIKTLDPELVRVNGKLGVKTKWQENLQNLGYSFKDHIKTKEHSSDMANLYHAAVITNNRDAIGLEFDNVMRSPEGNLISVDQGGSMHFRAMGGSKEFNHESIPERDSMRDERYQSGQVFNHSISLHPEVESESIKNIKDKMTDDVIDRAISDSGLESSHAEIIKSRRDLLFNKSKV